MIEISAVAIFSGEANPILAQSFISMLIMSSQTILGPNSNITTSSRYVTSLASGGSSPAKNYTIRTAVIP